MPSACHMPRQSPDFPANGEPWETSEVRKALHVRELNLGRRKSEELDQEKEQFIRNWLVSQVAKSPEKTTLDSPISSPITSRKRRFFDALHRGASLRMPNSTGTNDENSWEFGFPQTPPPAPSDVATSPVTRRVSHEFRRRKMRGNDSRIDRTPSTPPSSTGISHQEFLGRVPRTPPSSKNVGGFHSPVLSLKNHSFRKKQKMEPSVVKVELLDTVVIDFKEEEESFLEEKDGQWMFPKCNLSPFLAPSSQCIETLDSGDEDQGLRKIKDEGLERTTSVLIEDPEIPFDSDKTYCSVAEQIIHDADSEDDALSDRRIIEEVETPAQGISEKISQVTTYTKEISSDACGDCSIVNSNDSHSPGNKTHFWVSRTAKKKKKPKKGSLGERIQMLVNQEISSVRLWRHQLGQSHFQGSSSKCISLRIYEIYSRFERQFLKCSVIDDSHNLLASSFSKDVNDVVVMTVPEIVGVLQWHEKMHMKLYVPWNVIDAEHGVISTSKFTIDVLETETREKTTREVVLQEFDCLCLEAGRIVGRCDEKYLNHRHNVIRNVFDFD